MSAPILTLGAGLLAGALLGLGQLPTLDEPPTDPEVFIDGTIEPCRDIQGHYECPPPPVPFEGDREPLEQPRNWPVRDHCGGAE